MKKEIVIAKLEAVMEAYIDAIEEIERLNEELRKLREEKDEA